MKTSLVLGLFLALISDFALAQPKPEKRRVKKSKPASSSPETSSSESDEASKTSEEPPPSISGETTSEGDSKPIRDLGSSKKGPDAKASNDSNPKGPSWMFGLNLIASPNNWFESDSAFSSINLSQAEEKSTTTDTDGSKSSAKEKTDTMSINIGYDAKTSSKKIAYGISTQIEREKVNKVEAKSTEQSDTPKFYGYVSAQVRPGIWIGYGNIWQTAFSKRTSKVADGTTGNLVDEKSTSREESAFQAVSLEVLSASGHAGLDYFTYSAPGVAVNQISFPIRFGITETLFTGIKLTSTQFDFLLFDYKGRSQSVATEIGQQFPKFGYRIEYNYVFSTYGFPSESTIFQNLTNEKEKELSISFMMGSPKGVRFGAELSYSDSKSEAASSVEKTKTPGLSLFFASAR